MFKHMLWGLVVMAAYSICMEEKSEPLNNPLVDNMIILVACTACGNYGCMGTLPGQRFHGRNLRKTWPPLAPDMIQWKRMHLGM